MEFRDVVKFLVMFFFGIESLVLQASDGSHAIPHYLGPARTLNFTETCAAHRYRAEEHRVRTADGYLLTVFRVGRAGCAPRRPPVLMMHGLLQSADAFLDPGPRAGLPFLLADRCFDVWVGNMRGNYYARRHERLDPDRDAEFWDFSIDDIGVHDIPATVDYVLDHTGAPKLNYIGFSQGSSSFFIMCSERPGSCERVGLQINLAPAVKLTSMRSTMFRVVTGVLSRARGVLSYLGSGEVFARSGAWGRLASLAGGTSARLCEFLLAAIDAPHPGSLTDDTLRRAFGHFPAGASVKMFVKYEQSLRSDGFEKFDHGAGNMQVYGTERPPAYNLSAVTAPVLLLYGDGDHLVDAQDVRWLRRRLPNVVGMIRVDNDLWNHMDFLYSQHIPTLLFPHIDKYLTLYSDP